MVTNSDKKYWYHVEDGELSYDFEDTKLLGNEGNVVKVWDEGSEEAEIYILFIDGDYIECIGDINRSFPKNWNEHIEIRKSTQELRRNHDNDEE